MKFPLPARRPLIFALAAALSTTGLVTRAQTPAPGDMTIAFQVLSRDGSPVTDLKPEEVTLRVGGRQRQVKSLRLVRSGGGAAEAGKASAMPPPYATNSGGGSSSGRLIFVVVDTESMRPSVEKPLKDAIGKLTESLAPTDRIGLVTAPRPTLTVAPTTDHAAFRKAIEPLAAAGSQVAAVCRTRDVLDQTTNLLSSLTPSDNAIVVVTSASLSVTGSSSGCEVTTSEYQRLQRTMDMAGAQVFVVQAQDTVAERNEGLEQLAGITEAGAVIRLAGGGDDPLARIPRETASHYEVTFAPEASERNGQMARLEVRVNRGDTTVRNNSEVLMGKADTAGPTADAATMIKTTTQYTGLPLRAVAVVHSRGEGDRLNLFAMIEPNEPGVKLTALSAAVVDGKSIVTNNSANEKQLAGQTIVLPLAVAKPGTYRLRAAANDAKGRSGAVDYTFDAQLATLGPLKFGGLIMGSPDGGCTPKMQYTTETAVCVVMEMYGAPTAPMTAKLELVGADGSVLMSEGMGGSQTAQADRFNLAVAKMDISSLKPGDYTLRAVIGMQGAGEVTVSRTLRKVAK